MYHIKDLQLSADDFSNYIYEGANCDGISNLSKVNLFVGTNNSGKSRFVRQIFLINKEELIFSPTIVSGFNELVSKIKNEYPETKLYANSGMTSIGHDLWNSIKNLNEINFIQSGYMYASSLTNTLNKMMTMTTEDLNNYLFHSAKEQVGEMKDFGERVLKELDFLLQGNNVYEFEKVYIPTLRGLRPLGGNEDWYKQRTQRDYFCDDTVKDNVFTGLDMYEHVRDLLLGNLDEREIITDFQKFLGETFFNGQNVALIPSRRSDVLNVKIGDEKEQPIYNLGDGVQSIIILTFPLFLNRGKKMLVFIEEPELYLHPGLQRKLLETFMDFDDYQYFIATHSNHFLDLTLDIDQISVYTFRKDIDSTQQEKEKIPKFHIENVSNEENDALEMLGVKNSSVLMSNCTIWVEGITDRFYLRHYLNLYQSHLVATGEITTKFREDLHYSFVEYSGGNITHWSFLDDTEHEIYSAMKVERLCSRLFLITDKDSEKKLARQKKLEDALGDRYYCISCKEVENLLSKDVLLNVVAEYEKKSVDELNFKTNFSEKTYSNRYLGGFIEDNLVDKQRRGTYKSASGTVSDKVNFCKKAINHIKSLYDMSEEAVDLCKKLFEFIKQNNG